MSSDYLLHVPLDATSVEEFDAKRPVKVVVKTQDGKFHSKTTKLDQSRKGEVLFTFKENPGASLVMIGPDNATDEEMEGIQTLRVNVSTRQWKKKEITLTPVLITPHYWHWWLIWCRKFVLRGRVQCANGKGVPGARVCAYDVDWWWWWSSRQQVGCAVTDQNGNYEIHFSWCCWWWPWWWWRKRFWMLEPRLVEYILPVLKEIPDLKYGPDPTPWVDMNVFKSILDRDYRPGEFTIPRLEIPRIIGTPPITTLPTIIGREEIATPVRLQPKEPINFDELPKLQEQLLKRLPKAPELNRLRIWPWWPWYPWSDCTPDIIFKVTQDCEGEKVIVNEHFHDMREIDKNVYNVRPLIANSDACCGGGDEELPGNCVDISNVCIDTTPVSSIGGNINSPVASPAGYLNPGAVSTNGDRPYAGQINIYGNFGSDAHVDYYEFEWENPYGSNHWEPLPVESIKGFNRIFHGPDPALPGHYRLITAPFPVEDIDLHHVIKSREYFENTYGGTWGLGQTYMWTSYNVNLFLPWLTENNFANGLYKLRLKGYRMVDGHLNDEPGILNQCTIEPLQSNYLLIRTDNRVDLGVAHRHQCGAGTVHSCTNEPDTEFTSIKIRHNNGTEEDVRACSGYTINETDKLVIDFVVHDPEGHLAKWTLRATYGNSLACDLLNSALTGWTLTPAPSPTAWGPIASQVGPEYADALSPAQGAHSPYWYGGAIRLVVKAKDVFPITCCYQLELRGHKRTIVNCDHSFWGHTNYSEYSFMITVA